MLKKLLLANFFVVAVRQKYTMVGDNSILSYRPVVRDYQIEILAIRA